MKIPPGYDKSSAAAIEALEYVITAANRAAAERGIEAVAVVIVLPGGGVTSGFMGLVDANGQQPALARLLAHGPDSLKMAIKRAITGQGGRTSIVEKL